MPNKTVCGRLEDSSQNVWLASLCAVNHSALPRGVGAARKGAAVLTAGGSFLDERIVSVSKIEAGL